MNAAAELPAEIADPDEANLFPVFFLEDGDRALLQAFVKCGDPGLDRDILPDLLIDQELDLPNLLFTEGREVGEIETEPVGRHQRSGLFDVIAQNLTQGGVE